MKFRITFALPLEQLLPAYPLRVIWIPNLEPSGGCIEQVRIKLALRHNYFKVTITGKLEEFFPSELHMITV